MINKYYACYEMRGIGWCLVVYHDEKPGKAAHGGEVARSAFYNVPEEMIDMDGSPNMGKIAKAFPKPEVKHNVS